MISYLKNIFKNIDWVLLGAVLVIAAAGVLTMNSFIGTSKFSEHQLVWLSVSLVVFFLASGVDWRFMQNTKIITWLFVGSVALLSGLFVLGSVFKGAQSWFDLGAFSFQPADPVQLVVILILAKYFSRRHIEIANIRHIIVSGFYVFIIFVLILLQPDFGSAIIIFLLWLGMVLVSGISKKHLLVVFLTGLVVFVGLWGLVFKPYQKERISTFIHPLTDIHGAGYNSYQATIAIGSGQVLGKGIGYGTQSRLKFLPEYQTDFIFAAFAEEWGLIGVLLLFLLYAIIFWRMINISSRGSSNFEVLFGLGLTIIFFIHFVVHVGMNVSLLPVTGKTLPFMSYGGSHLLTEFFGLGILMGMKRHNRAVHKDISKNEILGVV
jgi:rod shape determining protein RodA